MEKEKKKIKKKEKAQMSYQQLNHKNPAVCQVCFPTLRTQMLAVSSRTDPTVLQTWLLQYTGFHIPEQICIYKKKILLFWNTVLEVYSVSRIFSISTSHSINIHDSYVFHSLLQTDIQQNTWNKYVPNFY